MKSDDFIRWMIEELEDGNEVFAIEQMKIWVGDEQ